MDSEPGPFKLGQHGGKRVKGQQGANSTLKRGSTSTEYILARLEREQLTEWLDAIHAGKVSAFAAACELGWAKRPQNLGTGSDNAAKRRALAIHRAIDVKALIG